MMEIKITSFQGPYKFLSNFWMCTVIYEDITYTSSEHAYQAAKTLDIEKRKQIADCKTAGDSKRAGRKLVIRSDWEEVKYQVMLDIVTEKFKDSLLKSWLKNTGNTALVEFNTWHDNVWGNCTCPKCVGIQGQNYLGRILMEVRSKL